MIPTEFRTIVAGSPKPNIGEVLYVMRYPFLSDEEYYIQRFAPGSGFMPQMQDVRVQTFYDIAEAAKIAANLQFPSATWHINRHWYRQGPIGTILGVKTMAWASSVLESIETWDLPAFTQTPELYGIVYEPPSVDVMDTYAPFGYIVEAEIRPGVYVRWVASKAMKPSGEYYVNITLAQSSYMVPTQRHYVTDANQPWFIDYFRLYIKSSNDDPGPLQEPIFHLYHTHEINCTITPPHGTPLSRGSNVYIGVVPDASRTLTEFIVQGTERLPDAFIVPTTDEQKLIAKGIITDETGNAEYIYGPVNSDVYVGAAALAEEIEETITAGIPVTIQMVVDDCYSGAWSFGETDLPAEVVKSVDSTGLVTLYVPEDVYDGIEGTTPYLEVVFTGFSQTVSLKLLLTINPVPAFGTVWTGVEALDETPQDVILGSDGFVYILGATKVWKAPADLSSFVEITTDGSAMVDQFHSLVETADGTLVTADGSYIWTKKTTDATFSPTILTVSPDTFGAPTVRLVGSPASNIVVATYKKIFTTAQVAKTFNIATVAGIAEIGISAANPGWIQKGIVADDGAFILNSFGAGAVNTVVRVAPDGLTAATVNARAAFVAISRHAISLADDGRIYSHATHTTGSIVRYSDDNGATWSADIAMADGGSYAMQPLKANYLVYSTLASGNPQKRTTDNFGTTAVVTAIGQVNAYVRLATRVLVAVGVGNGTHNVFKSEV